MTKEGRLVPEAVSATHDGWKTLSKLSVYMIYS